MWFFITFLFFDISSIISVRWSRQLKYKNLFNTCCRFAKKKNSLQKLEKAHRTPLHSNLSSSWVQLDGEHIFQSNEIS